MANAGQVSLPAFASARLDMHAPTMRNGKLRVSTSRFLNLRTGKRGQFNTVSSLDDDERGDEEKLADADRSAQAELARLLLSGAV
jgi:hypothetical protein